MFSRISNAAPIQFSSGVKSGPKDQIIQDLKVLENFKFKNVDPQTLKVLGIDELTGKSALKWLEDRIQYIVEQEFSVEKNIYLIKNDIVFPNDFDAPKAEREKMGFGYETPDFAFYMANLTPFIYNVSKWNQAQYGLKIPQGVFKSPLLVPVTSIRAGIIQIGGSLFKWPVNKDKNAVANSIGRISIYFHEARHSDGNGDHLGFPHVDCSDGSLECEDSLNGSYSTAAAILGEMIKSCDQCTSTEKEKLTNELTGLGHAQLPHTKDGQPLTFLDPTPEGL